MHPRHRPGGFGSSRTPPPSRHPSKSRGDFPYRPPNWVTPSREPEQPPSYGVNKYGLPSNPRVPYDDRGDRDDERMSSEATRLAAEYFASKGNGGDKLPVRGGRFEDPTADKYFSYINPSPPVREDRGVRSTQHSRAPFEETSFSHSDSKYDSKLGSKFPSYREPEKVSYDESKYARGGLYDIRKYDTIGGRGDVAGNSHYENTLSKERLGNERFMNKYESHHKGSPFEEPGSGAWSPPDTYASDKPTDRGEKERERGGRGERDRDRDRDRDDRGDRGRRSDFFSSDRKSGSSGAPGGRYDRNRREDPIPKREELLPNKRKSRPFETHNTGDGYESNDFLGGKDVLAKEQYAKELHTEQQRPPTYMTLLEAESSRRREDPDYGLEIYEFPTSLGGIPRQEFSRPNPSLLDRNTFREPRGSINPQFREDPPRGRLDPQFREDPPRGRDGHRRELERDLSRESAHTSMFGERDRTLLGLKADTVSIGGHPYSMRRDKLPTLTGFDDFDDVQRGLSRVQPLPVYESDRSEPHRLGPDTVDYGFSAKSYLEKEKSHYSSYEREPVRHGEPESHLRDTFESSAAYDKGLPPLLDDRSRNRYDASRRNTQQLYVDRHTGQHSQRDLPILSGSRRGGRGWRGDGRDPPPRRSIAERLGPLNDEKSGFLQHGLSEGPAFHHRVQVDYLPERNLQFEGRRPLPDFRDRDDHRGRGRGRGRRGFSSREAFHGRGGPPRKFQKWEQEGELQPRSSSHAEELFRMHNMRAKKPTTEPVKKPPSSQVKKPPSSPHPKEPSKEDHSSDWDADIEEKAVEVQKTEPQGDWEAVSASNYKTELKFRTEQENAMDVLLQAQHAASLSSGLFLKDLSEDDDDDDYPMAEDEDEADDDSAVGSVASDDEGLGPNVTAKEQVMNSREEKAYNYFVKLFQDNHQLRKLYEEERNCGQFVCLVCSAEDRKVKKFPDVVSMLQHSRKITKTKKVFEHRGYARALCYLLGWDPKAPSSELLVRGCIPAPEEEKITEQVMSSSRCTFLPKYKKMLNLVNQLIKESGKLAFTKEKTKLGLCKAQTKPVVEENHETV